jgi:polysaccharide export outer membrane protein
MTTLPSFWRRLLAPILVVALAMAGLQPAVAQEATPQAAEDEYRIGVGDVLRIAVWKDQDLSSTVKVRPDGVIAMPLVGELRVSGRTPADVQAEVTKVVNEFVTAPYVTIIVEEINSRKIYLAGAVARPGVYDMLQPTRLMQAIAMAGGTTEFAKEDRVVVIREGEGGKRFEASMKAIARGKFSDNLLLRPGDTIIIP